MAHRFATSLSAHPVPAQAVGEVLGAVLEQLAAPDDDGPPRPPDLALLFATGAHVGALDDIVRAVRSVLAPTVLAGSTGVSVVGGSEELEDAPGLVLWAARFDDADAPVIARLRVVPGAVGPGGEAGVALTGLPQALATPAGPCTAILLSDPFSFPTDEVVGRIGERNPQAQVVGGMASAGRGPGGNRIVVDGDVHDDGAVVVVLPPQARTTAVVSQGCRPIGDPMVVTRAERNALYELASEGALERLQALIGDLDPEERARVAAGLHIGRVIDEQQLDFGPGDFLVRAVLGATKDAGAIVVGEEVPVGATVQFQVRDAATADAELRSLLGPHAAFDGGAALVFTCNGRGERFFGRPHHDAELVGSVVGPATAGMFCAGEIGPVGGRSFLHGFTASVLLFDPDR